MAVTILGICAAVAVLVPLRSSIDVDTAALVLVVPVVLGVTVGGFPAAPVGVVAGFLAYDFFFIPPYYTFRVGATHHWVGLFVYGVVGLAVAGLVAQLQRARNDSEAREAEGRMLAELASTPAGEDAMEESLGRLVHLARRLLGLTGAAVVLAGDDSSLRVVAQEGITVSDLTLRHLAAHRPKGGFDEVAGSPGVWATALPVSVGTGGAVLVAHAAPTSSGEPEDRLLTVFAHQAGVAVDRARLAAESRRRRTLEEVDRLRSALVGSVSHDLRTPLASIKASVSDLADAAVELSDGDRRMLLRTIEEETDRLSRFVTNLLDMSRIEAGALEVRPQATPLNELVEEVLHRSESVLQHRPVEVDIADLPLVDVDYFLVGQVLANLLENAGRYTPPGTLIRVTAAPLGRWVEVRVSDTGPGIPSAERGRIFDAFYRPSGDAGPGPGQGSGMGLAICAGVVAAHGGHIWTEPTPGGGATFVFRLPTVVARPEPPGPPPSVTTAGTGS
jgi:K+-sensing histidine kinase KdpD